MRKPLYLWLTIAVLAIASSGCKTVETVPEKIEIPASSQTVFSVGINFDSGVSSDPGTNPPQEDVPQTQEVHFTAPEPWTATASDTKASTWLTVLPDSGAAGDVEMQVTAQPNTTYEAREATVRIKSGNAEASFTVKQKGKPRPVESVTLDRTSLELTEGESATLTATVAPENATYKTVTWSSSDATVAAVDASGKVTAVKAGEAVITTKSGDKTATCTVKVNKKVIAVSSVTLEPDSLELIEGESATLTATVSPDDATEKTVTWSSSDETVATVDETGTVTAVKVGEATITAQAGEQTATCKVTVKPIPVSSITLDKTSLTLTEDESATLTATVKPDNATDKTVIWSSSDASIAKVDQNGKVTAVKEGTATITAKVGEKSATCNVTVSKKVIAVTSITLSKTELKLEEGGSATLTATVKPDNATDKTVTWTSSDKRIATVDASGKVTAIKEGTATITAKAGDKDATCSIIVKKASSGSIEDIGFGNWNLNE